MKIRSLSLLLIVFLFVTCKKDKKPAQTVTAAQIVGSYTLALYQTNFGSGVNASISQYPCMMYNTMTFYNDLTSKEVFLGSDTCFITSTHSQWSGTPQLDPQPSTWSLKGNTVYLTYPGNPHHIPGQVATVNNKLQITFRDTVPSGSNVYYITSVEVKQ